MGRLYKQLVEYGNSDYYGFHMPGHKRNDEMMGNEIPYKLDITEIEGFDDLHHAREILKEAQERAARVYHADETHYLINGSTSGILSAVLGCTGKGGKILMARNCHKSVYAAVYLNELVPIYIYPEQDDKNGLNGAVDAEKIRRIFVSEKGIEAVIITSPTYDGVVSDVDRIAETAHEFGCPLIVDEAHGAHFGFHSYFPVNANQRGADVVIHSLHKTLPSLTQTALLHLNGDLVNRERIRGYIHMLQTSSPSYVLMAGMDECIRFLETDAEFFSLYQKRLEKLREELKGLKKLRMVETDCYDDSKIVISTRGTVKKETESAYDGKMLYKELLERYHLQMEMASRDYVLAMTSVCDTEDGFSRLKTALFEIDASLKHRERAEYFGKNGENTGKKYPASLPHLERVYTSAQTGELLRQGKAYKMLPFKESIGKVALEYAYVYPPGIPMIVPGERISEETVHLLELYEKAGFDIEGLSRAGKMKVLMQKR